VITSVPIAFLAGVLSVVSPCVLPLVPGYLSIVSAGEATRLGQPGVTRRVVAATLPFFAGFTIVFVVLGAAAAFVAERLGPRSATWIAGFVLVAFGLAFMSLLPLPQRVVAPGVVGRARTSGSSAASWSPASTRRTPSCV
jgi:cytochrome c-type biogenesis protein